MAHTANLHWCRAEDKDRILAGEASFIDSKSVHQDKKVQLFASATVKSYNPQPPGFQIRRESFFLKKLIMKAGGHWRQINPIDAVQAATGKWFAQIGWDAGSNDVTKQSHYFFRDNCGNSSGSLTVTETDHSVTRQGVRINGKLVHKVPGLVEVGVDAFAGRVTDVHRLGASRDPDVRMVLMYPGGEGEADLIEHVARLLASQSGTEDSYSDGDIAELSDNFLSRDAPWVPTFGNGESVMRATIGPGKDAQLEVSLDQALELNQSIRTAYAIRAVDVTDESNFVVSDVVEIEKGEDILLIRG
jgi:hypothetical protein